MQITCSKESLQKAVSIVSKAVSSKTTMPILECILIDASHNTITVTANDTELGIETILEGTIFEAGKLAIEAKLFSEIVRKLPDSIVSLTTQDNSTVLIVCDKIHFSIPCRNTEEFTYMPAVEKTKSVSMSQFTLKEIIRQTIFSIADNESSPQMGGELLEINENQLRLVSLDGHRISIRNVVLKDVYDPVKVIIPGKTLNEVSKILTGDNESTVTMYFTLNHIVFEFDQTIVVSRLIEGEYYRINQMLNSDYATKIRINKKELSSCIDRATLLVKESDKKPIVLNITDNQMQVKLNSSFGVLQEEIAIEKTGKDIMIGFNPKFISDAIRVIDDEVISIYMINPKSPCFIRDHDSTYTYLILPVNFNVN